MRRPTNLALFAALLGCEASPVTRPADAPDAHPDARDAIAISETSIDLRDVITTLDGALPPRDASGPDAMPPFDAVTTENRTCATAHPTAPAVFENVPAHLGSQPAACSGGRPALWYTITVPAGHRVRAEVFPTNVFDERVAVALVRDCDGTCLGSSHFAASWTNEGPETTVHIAVWSQRETLDGRLRLTLSLRPPAENATCANAAPLPMWSISGDTVRSSTAPPACLARPAWRTIFFRTTLPPGNELVIVQRPGTVTEQGFAILDGCGATDCLAVATPPLGAAMALRYRNTRSTPREVVIACASDVAAGNGLDHAVGAEARILAPADNATCARATPLRSGEARDGETPFVGTTPAPSCGITGPETNALYYSVRVGAGEQLAVAVETSHIAPRVRLLDGCAATTCLAASASVSRTIVAWENTDTAPRDVTVALSLAETLALDPARLRVASAVVPYRVTRRSAMCDAMTGATPWTTSTSFLGSTERRSVPLPFAFSWFGRAMRHVVPAYDGFAELWPEPHASGTDALGDALPIPTLGDVVAPFVDRINTSSPPTVVTRAFASAPAHFTVQWSDVRLADSADAPLTYQAKLFEDGAVEFHYCSMGTTPRGTGAEATIGVQGGVGPFARGHAIRQAGAARTGDAVRFAP